MVRMDPDMPPAIMKTKDFAAVHEDGMWYIDSVRKTTSSYERPRLDSVDAADFWLNRDAAHGLLLQFWCRERARFEATDDDEAYALLIHIQKVFSQRILN